MLIHNFNPIAINFFIFEIRWYSLAYIFGILGGWFYAKKILNNLKHNKIFENINNKDFDDLISYLVIGIIVGGRLGYILIYNFEYYFENPIKIFFIWEGGMSFHGGLCGVVISSYIFLKEKIKIFLYLDVIAIVSPIGIFFGRIANFINAELYGKITTMPWGVIFLNIDNNFRHPSQIYEALLEGLLLFLILNILAFKKKMILNNGLISGFFLILYSLFRFFSEFFREPDIQIGYFFSVITIAQILSMIMFLCGIILIYKKK